MTTPREEYLQRRVSKGLLPLSYLHHHVMDRIFADFSDGFSFDDVLEEILKDPAVADDSAIAGHAGRVKLVVIRAIEGLVATGMIRESASERAVYHFVWTPN